MAVSKDTVYTHIHTHTLTLGDVNLHTAVEAQERILKGQILS